MTYFIAQSGKKGLDRITGYTGSCRRQQEHPVKKTLDRINRIDRITPSATGRPSQSCNSVKRDLDRMNRMDRMVSAEMG
jgi:hypothetical protein